jgi:hypothetical protein
MESSELRIGNWIIDHEAEPETTIYWQVEQICTVNGKEGQLGVRFRNGSCWTALECVEPIEINQEWRARLGLDSDYKKRDFGLCTTSEHNYYQFYFRSEIDGFAFFPIVVKHVHQIQNFFFSLNGEELELVDPSDIHCKTNNK